VPYPDLKNLNENKKNNLHGNVVGRDSNTLGLLVRGCRRSRGLWRIQDEGERLYTPEPYRQGEEQDSAIPIGCPHKKFQPYAIHAAVLMDPY
jgi:hypothetical protein